MTQLPSIATLYTRDIARSPAENQAAYFGVEKQFLFFARQDYVNDSREQYDIHDYASLSITNKVGESLVVEQGEQANKALELLDSGCLWCDKPGLIIINSPHYIFNGNSSVDVSRGALGFLAHILCSLAHRVVSNKVPRDIEVNFLETMSLDYAKSYTINQRHLLVWGPISDNSGAYELHKTTQLLFSFRSHTKILLTSTTDLGSLLDSIKVHIKYVDYYFNFNEKPIVEVLKKRKTRAVKKIKQAVGV